MTTRSMAKKKLSQVGRIALRTEGHNWVAYWAEPGTMKGAVFLGSLPMRFVQNPARKEAFMGLMRECVGDLFEDEFGVRPVWPDQPKPAPEHERSKE